MKKTRKFISIFAILFAAFFALSVCFFAACGKKDDDEKDDDTTTEQDENTGSTGGDDGTSGGSDGGTGTTHVHDYVVGDNADWTWNEDNTECTATATCTNEDGLCTQLYETVGADVTTESSAASCTETGFTWQVAKYNGVEVSETQKVPSGAALGHNVTAAWNEQGSTWIYTCSRGDAVSDSDPVAAIVYMAGTEAALSSALTQGGDIVLCGDVTGTYTVSVDTTIDLSGYTVTNASSDTSNTITVAAGAGLTVKDSGHADGGNDGGTVYGTVDSVAGGCAAILVEAGGEAVLDGGTYTRSEENSEGGTYYTVVNHGDMTINEGVTVRTDAVTGSSMVENGWSDPATQNTAGDPAAMTINGGVFESSSNSMIKNDECAKLVITGGTFNGNGQTSVVLNCAELEISEGTFTQKRVQTEEDGENAISNLVVWNYAGSNSTLQPTATISGGTFSGGTTATLYNDEGGTMTISGGSFDNAEYATVVNEGELTIDGGTFTSSGSGAYIYLVWGYKGNTTINDGTFTAGDATDYAVVASAGATFTVNGGTFGGVSGSTNLYGVAGSSLKVYGGTFTEDPTDYVDESCHVEELDDGTYFVAGGRSAVSVEGLISADSYLSGEGHADTDTDDGTGMELYKSEDEDTSVTIYGKSGSSASFEKVGKETGDGIWFQYAVKIGGQTSLRNSSQALDNCVAVTVNGVCTIKIYISSTGDARTAGLWTESETPGSYTKIAYGEGSDGNIAVSGKSEELVTVEITVEAAGTYYIGTNSSGGCYFYGLFVEYTA